MAPEDRMDRGPKIDPTALYPLAGCCRLVLSRHTGNPVCPATLLALAEKEGVRVVSDVRGARRFRFLRGSDLLKLIRAMDQRGEDSELPQPKKKRRGK
jgi:hypothetical protein